MGREPDRHLPYMPGIDAMRALAVLAVFLYHAGVGWMPGGFLGVDVFFVISGYLITSLLLNEYRREGRIGFKRFWLRRARRLLPAVGVFIAVTMVVAAFLVPASVASLRGDALASIGYVANWHFIFSHQSYFEQFQRPSLFRHLWSLSVEEQFYLVWPLVFAAGIMVLGRKRLLIGVIGGALASVALMALLFNPGADPTRVYFGTDTRAVGLLMGVALALVWNPWRLRREDSEARAPVLLDALGALSLGLVVVSFLSVHDYDISLFRGGFLWIALCSAGLLAAMANPASRPSRLLALPPVLWLGVRSYSFYLWHWPVLALTRPGSDVSLPRGILIPLQLCAVLALADLSYRFVERPFQGKVKLPLPQLPERWRRFTRPALVAAVPAVVIVVGWSGLAATGGSRHLGAGVAAASTKRFAKVSVDTRVPAHRHAPRIIALGDSVMVAARDQLAASLGPRFSMNARIGRQADDFVTRLQRLRAKGQLPDDLIVQMGNNGPLYSDAMNAIRDAVAGAGHVFLVTDHAPVSWVGESNHQLAQAAAHWPRTTLIDWGSVAGAKELTWDGIHLTPAGAKLYARLVDRAVIADGALAGAPSAASGSAPVARISRGDRRRARRLGLTRVSFLETPR